MVEDISSFIYSAIIVAIVVIIGALLPGQFDYVANTIKLWITDKLGWYYLILTTFIVFFCVFLILVLLGNSKLGKIINLNLFNFMVCDVQCWYGDWTCILRCSRTNG